MNPFMVSVALLVLILVQGGCERNREKIEHLDGGLQKYKNRYNRKQINQKGKLPKYIYRRSSVMDCPPPPGEGFLEIEENDIDLYTARVGDKPFSNLLFMCGYTQIRSQIPIGWTLELEESGSFRNVSTYNVSYRYVPVCCPGYFRNENDICEPKCNGECKDGICIAPGKCVCYRGYTENRHGHCVLKCPCACPNGQCYGDSCVCDTGYALDVESETCTPVCDEECINGDCIAPNSCGCRPGYRYSNRSHVCIPHCQNTENDRNSCSCDEGYELSEAGTCVPGCTLCDNGDCVGPEVCRCNPGYERRNEECVPVCRYKCVNGFCAAPNRCECNRGHVKQMRNICVYGCEPKCYNGDCVGHNQCECHEGFFKRDKTGAAHMCYPIMISILEAAGYKKQLINRKNVYY